MGKLDGRRWAACAVALAAAAGGCGEDAERLAKVGRHLGDKMELLAGGADGQLPGLHALRPGLDEMGLDTRVTLRLRWDKDLDGVEIRVTVKDAAVELQGTVPSLEVRQRAVAVARATVGVAEVVDRLEVAP